MIVHIRCMYVYIWIRNWGEAAKITIVIEILKIGSKSRDIELDTWTVVQCIWSVKNCSSTYRWCCCVSGVYFGNICNYYTSWAIWFFLAQIAPAVLYKEREEKRFFLISYFQNIKIFPRKSPQESHEETINVLNYICMENNLIERHKSIISS